MAEDHGKEEEKFDFTGEGEAVGYISLAQARLLAMQKARETPGEYGSQYQGASLAYQAVEDSENEDYYVVTLSFRPQTAFSGIPGQEQFFIEKEGTVAHRQVLSQLGRGRRKNTICGYCFLRNYFYRIIELPPIPVAMIAACVVVGMAAFRITTTAK